MLHLDHAITFRGTSWLDVINAYSEYPCIHPMTSPSSKMMTELLEQESAHSGHPHTIVMDNTISFISDELQAWWNERGITHVSCALYHLATNTAAKCLISSYIQVRTHAVVSSSTNNSLCSITENHWHPCEILNGP